MFELSKVTMSSREIADLVESRHDVVKLSIARLATTTFNDDRTIKKLAVINPPPMADYEIINGLGITTYGKEYLLSKRDSYIVVAQLSPEFTARLVDRWQELESKHVHTMPNYQEALRQLADSIDLSSKQQVIIEQQKPAVEFVERYVESTGNKGFREVCKLLKANEARFKEFLIEEKIMYRLDGKLMPYGCHLVLDRFQVKTGIAENEHSYTTAKFTPKGINWVAGLWAVHNLTC